MDKIILIGAGGHAKSCIDVIEQEQKYKIIGLIDLPENVGKKVLGYSILDTDSNLCNYIADDIYFLITLGQIKSPKLRQSLFVKLMSLNAKIATVISPTAYVSKYASVGKGSIVMHNALINAGAVVGNNCTINSKALIEHDVIIENDCHLSTGSIVNGKSIVKKGTFIGSNAVVVNNVTVGEYSFIKAGSLYK